jgi:predicted nucleotidyltransferase
MDALMYLPNEKKSLVEQIVNRLQTVDGIQAVVLGGSYASGSQHSDSDIDLGLYYAPTNPFRVSDIRQVAHDLSSSKEPVVTDFYEWGAWVNGGVWMQTAAGKVDFLYRNLDQVTQTIEEARQGICHHDYDQQPSNGFYSVIYLAETSICLPLYDPHGHINRLKQRVQTYPPLLRERIIQDGLWNAEFTLSFARTFAKQNDIYNTTACLVRIAANLTQVLFALNETYFLREKQVMNVISGFPLVPEDYANRLTAVLAAPCHDRMSLEASVQQMNNLWNEVVGLTEGKYQPKYPVL